MGTACGEFLFSFPLVVKLVLILFLSKKLEFYADVIEVPLKCSFAVLCNKCASLWVS